MAALLGTVETAVVVILAFSALIFVHELGHFIAARLVGVRVERFFIGFDAWGMGLKKTIRGVEYGIGILPLGGYVKLAGQADNPREEKNTGAPDELRSKSLPAQALVFVGGVTMNVVFGFLVLLIAYLHGIPFVDNVIGRIAPDSAAAQAGLMEGDRVLEINGEPIRNFMDLQNQIVGNPGDVLHITVQREGEEEPIVKRLTGEKMRGRGELTTIGVMPPVSRIVAGVAEDPEYANLFEVGDEIVSVAGTQIKEKRGHMIDDAVADRVRETIPVEVLRDGQKVTVQSPVLPRGIYDLGFRYNIRVASVTRGGPAWNVGLREGDSLIGYETDKGETRLFRGNEDLIKAVKSVGLRPVDLQVLRNGETITVERIRLTYMGADPRIPEGQDSFLGIVSEKHESGFEVKTVLEDGPSAGKLQAGDVLLQARRSGAEEFAALEPQKALAEQIDAIGTEPLMLLASKGGGDPGARIKIEVKPSALNTVGVPRIQLVLADQTENRISGKLDTVQGGQPSLASSTEIPVGAELLQIRVSPDLETTFLYWRDARGNVQEVMKATPQYVLDDPKKAGLVGMLPIALEPVQALASTDNILTAAAWAARDTGNMSLTIYNFLAKLVTQEISPTAMGGPPSVINAIKIGYERGFGYLLYIVAFISVNLAVINLLPFPVLDGGHLLFLGIEAVKGSPPSDMVREVSQYIGIFCLLALMLTVTGMDIFFWLKG